MASADTELYQLDRSLIWTGFKQLAQISTFVTTFEAVFDLAASSAACAAVWTHAYN